MRNKKEKFAKLEKFLSRYNERNTAAAVWRVAVCKTVAINILPPVCVCVCIVVQKKIKKKKGTRIFLSNSPGMPGLFVLVSLLVCYITPRAAASFTLPFLILCVCVCVCFKTKDKLC